MREFYCPRNLNETPVLFTSRKTAELIKYAANVFLATKVTFINEVADLCERIRADVQDAAASGWTAVLDRNFFIRVRAMAPRAFPRTLLPSSAPPKNPAHRCGNLLNSGSKISSSQLAKSVPMKTSGKSLGAWVSVGLGN